MAEAITIRIIDLSATDLDDTLVLGVLGGGVVPDEDDEKNSHHNQQCGKRCGRYPCGTTHVRTLARMIVTTTQFEAGELRNLAELVSPEIVAIIAKHGHTRAEAADYCGIGLDKIKKAIRDYHLPAKRHGKNVVLLREDLDEWIDSWLTA